MIVKNILKQLTQFPLAINTAAENFSPALIDLGKQILAK